MILFIKSSFIQCMTLFMLLLTVPNAAAQNCSEALEIAKEYYYNADYDNVHLTLSTCIAEFNTYRTDYQSESYSGVVFQVYKLITSSYELSGLEYYAEDKENELIYFFDGIYTPSDVLDILYNTQI